MPRRSPRPDSPPICPKSCLRSGFVCPRRSYVETSSPKVPGWSSIPGRFSGNVTHESSCEEELCDGLKHGGRAEHRCDAFSVLKCKNLNVRH